VDGEGKTDVEFRNIVRPLDIDFITITKNLKN